MLDGTRPMCNVPPGKKGGLREVRVLARCAPVDCDRARGGDVAGGLRPAADIRANFGDPRLVPLRLHGAMHRREAGHQGGARMSQAQCRQSIAVVQGGARRRWTAADRERGAGEACTSGCGTTAASASRRSATSTSGNRRAARRRGGAGCSSSAGACGHRKQEAAIGTGCSRARCMPLRFRRALPRRESGQLCCLALPASQRRRVVAALPQRSDGHG